MSKVMRVVLELDAEDWDAVQRAISVRQGMFGGNLLPEGGGNLAGRVVAEICRVWEDMLAGGRDIADGSITPEAAEALAQVHGVMLAALKDARQFIANGIEFGYIAEPQPGTREAKTLPAIEAAIAKAEGR